MKKKFVIVMILLLTVALSILALIHLHHAAASYRLSGTYSAGNEPDKNNIYVVLKDENFTIYNQEEILESGLLKKINLYNQSDIYQLVSGENTKIGYMVHDKNVIILLDFRSMDLPLKKISTDAMYLDYEQAQ